MAELSAAGVDRIVCLSVNDPFVMAAWGASQGVGPEITMVSDGNAEFTEAVGMGVDASRAGMGMRSKRYAMVIEDGVVTTFLPEEDGFSAIASTGQCVVDALKAQGAAHPRIVQGLARVVHGQDGLGARAADHDFTKRVCDAHTLDML